MHQLTHRPLRLAVAVAVLTAALAAALIALPRDQAAATPPSGVTAQLLARGTVANASRVRVAGIKLQTRGPVDVATVQVTFQPGGSTGWHTTPARRSSPSRPASSPCTAPKDADRAPSAPGRRSWSSAPRTSTSPATRPAPSPRRWSPSCCRWPRPSRSTPPPPTAACSRRASPGPEASSGPGQRLPARRLAEPLQVPAAPYHAQTKRWLRNGPGRSRRGAGAAPGRRPGPPRPGDIGEVRYAEAEYLDEPADLAAMVSDRAHWHARTPATYNCTQL